MMILGTGKRSYHQAQHSQLSEQAECSHRTSLDMQPDSDSCEDQAIKFISAFPLSLAPADLFNLHGFSESNPQLLRNVLHFQLTFSSPVFSNQGASIFYKALLQFLLFCGAKAIKIFIGRHTEHWLEQSNLMVKTPVKMLPIFQAKKSMPRLKAKTLPQI